MKIITYTLGRQYSRNDDKLTTIVSNIITTPTELRKVLTNNIYISSNKEDRIRKISDAFELCYEVDKTIKNRNECDMLKINKSNELREKIIKVNEYKKEEF